LSSFRTRSGRLILLIGFVGRQRQAG
jgi:hypothetical protein